MRLGDGCDAKGERHRGTRDATWVGKSSLYQEEPSWKFLQFGIKGIPHLSVRKDPAGLPACPYQRSDSPPQNPQPWRPCHLEHLWFGETSAVIIGKISFVFPMFS